MAIAILLVTAQIAHGESPTVLRDALLKYFGDLNLTPVFVPRGHAVGDVMLPNGDFLHRAKECFNSARLKLEKPAATHFEEFVLESNSQIEGSFGLSLRQLMKLSAESDAFRKSRLVISFRDVSYQSVSLSRLKSAFRKEGCPDLVPIIDGTFTPSSTRPPTLLVFSEVFYGKPAVSLELTQGVNVNVALQKVKDVIGTLDLHAMVESGIGRVDRVMITSSNLVPIAVRVAFVQRPILNTTLGGGEDHPAIEGYLWEDSPQTHVPIKSDGLELILKDIQSQTSGQANPLRDKESN